MVARLHAMYAKRQSTSRVADVMQWRTPCCESQRRPFNSAWACARRQMSWGDAGDAATLACRDKLPLPAMGT